MILPFNINAKFHFHYKEEDFVFLLHLFDKINWFHIAARCAYITVRRLSICKYTVYFFSDLIFHSGKNVETTGSSPVFLISAVCLCSAANNCPFANWVWVSSVLFFMHCIRLLSHCSRGLREVGVPMHSCISYMGTQFSRCVRENSDWCWWGSSLLSPGAH